MPLGEGLRRGLLELVLGGVGGNDSFIAADLAPALVLGLWGS